MGALLRDYELKAVVRLGEGLPTGVEGAWDGVTESK